MGRRAAFAPALPSLPRLEVRRAANCTGAGSAVRFVRGAGSAQCGPELWEQLGLHGLHVFLSVTRPGSILRYSVRLGSCSSTCLSPPALQAA